MGTLGADQWGRYQILTGHEAPGHCFWCGAAVNNRRFCAFIGPVESHLDPWTHKWVRDERPRSWCDFQYWRHFGWNFAVAWCWERADGKCHECGTLTPQELRRTHHIIPLPPGALRSVSILNRPENLLPLCARHHGRKHSADISKGLLKSHVRSISDRKERQGKLAVYLCPLHGEIKLPLTGRKKQDDRTWARVEQEHQGCRPKPDPLQEGHLEAWRAWATA